MIRIFKDGGTRDTSNGKFAYYGFRHPLVEHSYGAYMHRHRKMPDGSLRDPDNWWKGWDKTTSLDCMVRHVVDLEALHAGLRVFKERVGNEERTHFLFPHEKPIKGWREIDEEECCNAIRFNSHAYLLEDLKIKHDIPRA